KRARQRDIVFLWVGGLPSSRSFTYMTRDVEKLGLARQIRFIPHQADPLPYMGTFDVFFLSSRADVYPLACLEAAVVAHTPLICFDGAGGMPELAGDGGGLVVPYLDAAEAAAAILTLVRDEERRLRMGMRL